MEIQSKSTTKIILDILKNLVISIISTGILYLIGVLVNKILQITIISYEVLFFLAIILFIFIFIFAMIIQQIRKRSKPFHALGITGLWIDEDQFFMNKGFSYTDYCRKFIKNIPDGQTIRILGYDWVEIFTDTSVLARDVFGDEGISRLKFKVILNDPEAPMVIEKRAWEMTWKKLPNSCIYPEGSKMDSLIRIKTKVTNCITVAKIFNDNRPQYFKLKLTPTMPCFSILMSATKVTGVIYSLPWKGKDTVIFEAKKLSRKSRFASKIRQLYGTDFYGFLEGYFDAMWSDPSWRTVLVTKDKRSSFNL